uniref:OmpH family outer membrane protein n=1 Tax=Parastrongyloides trichosuri TaxID=131310 RepID=A0A0N4ZK11_PARTI
MNKILFVTLLYNLVSSVSGSWFMDSFYNNIYYINVCSICYSKTNVMYFLSKISYDDRCRFLDIEKQTTIPRANITLEQDEFMKNQSADAQSRYEEYKKKRNETLEEAYKRMDDKIAKLSSEETKNLVKEIYNIIKNKSLSQEEEYNQGHKLISDAKFSTVKEGVSLIPSRFFADRFRGPVDFCLVEDPLKETYSYVSYYAYYW